ncbi:MAG: hypothetical protein WDZ82_00525 [Candidatus Paceibacterota bacterium]
MSPIVQIEITASAVAWYAAIVATLVGIAQIVAVWRDRKHVKIKIEKGIRIMGPDGPGPYEENTDYVAIRIINAGRREVSILTAGASLLKGGQLIPTDILKAGTVTLGEGKRYDAFVKQEQLDFSQIAYFYVTDATDSTYKKPIANPFRRLYWFVRRNVQIFTGCL